jgi:hypothetical protein
MPNVWRADGVYMYTSVFEQEWEVCVCVRGVAEVCVKLGITRTQLKTKLGGGAETWMRPGSAHNWYEYSSAGPSNQAQNAS